MMNKDTDAQRKVQDLLILLEFGSCEVYAAAGLSTFEFAVAPRLTMRGIMAFTVCLGFALPCAAQEKEFALKPFAGERILFLGDSNTYAGGFIVTLESYLRTRFPESQWDLVNLGLPSETVSGLSEADHPYPRPDVHERLERLLAKLTPAPKLVVVCYGMNDGIYAPYSEERHAKYTAGLEKLTKIFEAKGAKVVLMSPAPFDPVPVRKRLLPLDTKERFSYLKPFNRYDEVLARYAKDLLSWRDKGYLVVDAHSNLNRFLKRVREKNLNYTLSRDGIHPNSTGHALIALEMLRTMQAPESIDRAEIDATAKSTIAGKVAGLKASGTELSFDWTCKLPMPIDPSWDKELLIFENVAVRFNQLELKIKNLRGKSYELWEGKTKLGDASSADLAKGINLATYPALSSHRRAQDVLKKVYSSQAMLSRAWLDEVGHKRPDTPKGQSLETAQKIAGPMIADLQTMQQPAVLSLRLVRKN
jgi:lysophospholipase L1-like esterase